MPDQFDRFALIIANGDFEDPKLSRLNTPTRDAVALARVLDDPAIGGFEVTLLVDRPESEVRRAVARFYHRRRRDDLLLLYYTGHGIRDAHGDLYLATQDTEMEIASGSALSASFVREQMDKSSSMRKVVVLDCCHSGAFAGAMAGLGDSAGTQDAFAGSGYGRVILTASDAVELAYEGGAWLGDDRTSVFTHFMVEGLRTGAADLDGDGRISLDELYGYVYDNLLNSGYAKQTPHKFLAIEGAIFVAQAPRPAGVLPGWLGEALSSTAFTTRFAAVGELAQALHGEDQALAAAARAALTRVMETDDDPILRGTAATALGAEAAPTRAAPTRAGPTRGVPTRGVPASLPEPSQAASPPVSDRTPPPGMPASLTLDDPIELALVHVPAGAFLMGSDPSKESDASKDERPQLRMELPAFYIGRYSVTQAQYAAFVQATGHPAPKPWKDAQPLAHLRDHPVAGVSWHDARAFCAWLSEATGRVFRLPSEAEWEKAARGTAGRIYPWGDEPPTVDLCNCDIDDGLGAYLKSLVQARSTSPVGTYTPQGDSPYGCADMAGNVGEWTRSLRWDYPYDPQDGREDPDAEGARVLRGGTFLHTPAFVRCACRLRHAPHRRQKFYGFRVVMVP